MPDAPRPILLVSGGHTTQTLWAPLAEHYDLAFLAVQAAQAAAGQGLPAAPISSAVDADISEHIQNETVMLAAKVANNAALLSERFGGLLEHSGPELLNGKLPGWFPGFAHHLMGAAVSILAALDAIERAKRQIVGCIVHEDVSLDTRAMVAWCNLRGIPTFHVPHAPCHLLPGVIDIHGETRAQYIAAGGPAGAEFYISRGHDPAMVATLGVPQWDEFYHGAIPDPLEARRILKVPDGLPVICYIASWAQTTSMRSGFEDEFTAGWKSVLAQAQTRKAFLIAKLHPTDGRSDESHPYKTDMDSAGVAGLMTRHHFGYTIRASDVLVAQTPSNACLNGAILGVPSCYLTTEGFDYATALPYRGTPETIGEAIDEALTSRGSPAWDEFVAQYNTAHPDGDAAARVTDWIVARIAKSETANVAQV